MMTDKEIDTICQEAMCDGIPMCPWIGTPEYAAHRQRQQIEGMRLIRESFARSAQATRPAPLALTSAQLQEAIVMLENMPDDRPGQKR